MSETVVSENILGTEKINKLLVKFAVPSIISFVVNSVYNIVDQIFIGQGVGYLGNAATNVIYPLTVLAIACGMFLGDGSASHMSLSLGKGKKDLASQGVAFGLIATIILGVILAVVFGLFLEPLCSIMGGTESSMQYCLDYGTIIIIGVPFLCISCSYSSILRADGSPKFSMIGLLLGCIINIILDPVFIFVCGWGVKGAALATILGQIANCIVLFVYVTKKFKCVTITKEMLKTWTKERASVCRLGISSFIFQFAIVIAIILQNNVQVYYGALSKYGPDIPLAAFGVTMKVYMIIISIVNGLSMGSQPIYGYNYGRGNHDRVKHTYKNVFIISTIVLVAAFIVFQLAPMAIVSIFGAQDALYNEFAVMCLRIFLLALPIAGAQMITGTFFQSVGYPVPSSIVSLSRQILFLIPLLFILSAIFGIQGCLYVGPTSDICSFVLTLIMLKVYWKKVFNHKAAPNA